MRMFFGILFLVISGWWLGCLFTFMFGSYTPSKLDIGMAMLLAAVFNLRFSADYWEKGKSKRNEVKT